MAKTVYISGPMSGLPDLNYPAFDAAQKYFKEAGWEVQNPAEIGRNADAMRALIPGMPPLEWKHYMLGDFAALAACDAIALLPGWEKSKGATLELMFATFCGLTVLDAVTGEVLGLNHTSSSTKDQVQHDLAVKRFR